MLHKQDISVNVYQQIQREYQLELKRMNVHRLFNSRAFLLLEWTLHIVKLFWNFDGIPNHLRRWCWSSREILWAKQKYGNSQTALESIALFSDYLIEGQQGDSQLIR